MLNVNAFCRVRISVQLVRQVILQQGHLNGVRRGLVHRQMHHHHAVAAVNIRQNRRLHPRIAEGDAVPEHRQLGPTDRAVGHHRVGMMYCQVHRHHAVTTVNIGESGIITTRLTIFHPIPHHQVADRRIKYRLARRITPQSQAYCAVTAADSGQDNFVQPCVGQQRIVIGIRQFVVANRDRVSHLVGG